MSMGRKMTAAVLALRAEGLPPGIGTNELERRMHEKLKEHGCRPDEVPSRRTFLRHLDRLRASIELAPFGTLCHSKLGDFDGIVGAENSQDEKGGQ